MKNFANHFQRFTERISPLDRFFLIRLTFCRATNITDTNRLFTRENVLLSFFRSFSSTAPASSPSLFSALPNRFHSVATRSLLSAQIREGRRKVFFSRRGVFHFHLGASPFFVPLSVLFFVFSRADWTLRAHIRESSPRRQSGKQKLNGNQLCYFLKSSVKFIDCLLARALPIFELPCLKTYESATEA